MFAVTNRAPEQHWFDPASQPKNAEGRLFCQTMLPRQYSLILHSEGKAEAYDPSGKPLGPVEGNRYLREFGREVVQIDPGNTGTRTIFLHVLTAVDAVDSTPADVNCGEIKQDKLKLSIDSATTLLCVSE
jgi:hypothetical protein